MFCADALGLVFEFAICRRRVFRNLCLVCRQWNALLQTEIFREIVLENAPLTWLVYRYENFEPVISDIEDLYDELACPITTGKGSKEFEQAVDEELKDVKQMSFQWVIGVHDDTDLVEEIRDVMEDVVDTFMENDTRGEGSYRLYVVKENELLRERINLLGPNDLSLRLLHAESTALAEFINSRYREIASVPEWKTRKTKWDFPLADFFDLADDNFLTPDGFPGDITLLSIFSAAASAAYKT